MKHITSKLLSLLLCLAMLMSMVPVAYAIDGTVDTGEGSTSNIKVVAEVGQTSYATLAEAITAAEDDATVTLLADVSEDVTITKSITLDLGDKTLTNTSAGKATISVTGGTVTVKNGTVIGGASYYNIEVTKNSNADLILENVTATAGNTGSSMIDNWGTLTIESGTYTGGLDVVKSEEGSMLNIHGGKFTLNYSTDGYTGVILNYGTATITDGEFIQNATSGGRWDHPQVVATGVVEGYPAITKITGGTFTNNMSGEGIFRGIGNGTYDNFEVSGGTFNEKVSDDYCADGFIPTKNADGTYGVKEGKYVAQIGSKKYETLADAIRLAAKGKTVKLLADTDITSNGLTIAKGKSIKLDLSGHSLKAANTNDGNIKVCGKLTLTDSTDTAKNGTGRGKVYTETSYSYGSQDKVLIAAIDGGTFIMESGLIDAASFTTDNANKGQFAVSVQNENSDATVIINGGHIKAGWYAVAGNGQDSTFNGNITVNGGILESTADYAIYHPHTGTTTINGGTVYGAAGGVSLNRGKLVVNGGTITSKGTGTTGDWGDGTGKQDAAAINVNAKYEETSVEIKGGTITAEKDAILLTNGKNGTIAVSGGTFSSKVLPEYCADGFVPKNNGNGTYGVEVDTSVAEVNGVKYKTLQAAVDAATRNATVKLLADTRENVTISTPYVTLDLNGHTLNGSTGERKPALTITARMTVKDSSEAQTGTIMREDTAENSGVSSHYVIDVQGGGWLTFESGTVKNDSGAGGTKGASLVRVGDDSVAKYPGLNIKGGTFTQDNFIVIKVDRGDLFLNGGTLNCANSYAVENWHRATIKGGTVNGNVSSWTYSSGLNSELTINGGTVNGNVESVSYDGAEGKLAKVAITGGTVNGTLSTKRYGEEAAPSKDMATIEVTGGTFSSDPTKYVVEDSAVTNNSDGTFGVAKAYLAKVGDTSYYTMGEAFKAQTASGAEIVLLRDYTTGSTFNSGSVARVVNLNGYTWTCTGTDANSAAFEINNPNASLTVKNGKIVSSQLVGLIPSAMGGTIKYDNSSLTFENVEMSTTATSGIETNGNNTNDSVTLKDSTLNVPNGFGIYFPSSGSLTIDNSTINAKTMGVQVCAGNLSINAGSTITVSGGPVVKTENDGAIQDGAAISIVNRTGYKGLGDITVTGGTFTAKSGNAAIKAYNWDNTTKKEDTFTASDKVSVSGGTFSSAVKPEYCAPGFVPKANSDGTYGVTRPSSGSSSSDPTYAVSAPSKTENGSVTVSPKSASKGDTVTVTVKPDSGYVLETLTVTDKNGNELTLKDKGNGKYTFTMPAGKVEVKATFMEDNSVLNFFYDVPNGAYFYEAVKWAVENGITDGVGDNLFAPGQPCTRAQIVTFLWRAAGSPEPKTASSFTDVSASAYYAKAVAWAVENGITNGMTATMFAPDATCTRGQSVTFLYRALKGTASGSTNFTDVKSDAFYADAINWAVANNVTNGTSNTTFSPNADCTRAEIVTFLYRAYQGK
ncbi:S-layer homology domain-containing protein [bacterium]|nr:S-layer homology domain-containing protein [bacterium]